MKLWGAVALSFAFAAGADAHTTVKAQATEGVRDDNALRIGHGCADVNGITAQSVVFPTDAPELTTSDPGVTLTSLDDVVVPSDLAGLVQSIQSRDIFGIQDERLDANGNVVGFFARAGYLKPNLVGRVPFQFSAPSFVATSCAKRLLIRVAIADICSARAPALEPAKVNLWIPDNGSAIAAQGAAADVEGIGEPATLIVNRASALPPGCGAGYDVVVTPSAAQVDRDLPIRYFWPVVGRRESAVESLR